MRRFCFAAACAAAIATTAAFAQTPPPPPSAPVTVAIHADAVRQKIYGFGGSITFGADTTADFAGRDKVYEALFGELKLDILRIRNWSGYGNKGNPGASEERFSAITRQYVAAARQWSDPARRGPDKGPVRVMFTSWSPPEYLKSNGLVSGRSDGTDKGLENVTLARDASGAYRYDAYADWWLASLGRFHALTGVYPEYIALQNEQDFLPSYEGMKLLPTEGIGRGGFPFAGYDHALAAVSDRLNRSLGPDAPKIIGPETFTIQADDKGILNVTRYADPATPQGRATLDRLFGISFHLYGSGADNDPPKFHAALTNLAQTFHNPAQGVNKPLFETEYIEGKTLTQLAGIMNETLTTGEGAAYLVWVISRAYDPSSSMLVSFKPGTDASSIVRHERFYAMKHFSAFVGEGWYRVDAGVDPVSGVRASAYRSPSDKALVAILINPTEQAKRVRVAPSGDGWGGRHMSEAYRSTEGADGERWRSLGPVGADRTVEMPPKSVVTLLWTRQ